MNGDDRDGERHSLRGSANLQRLSRWRFPVQELVQDGIVLARLGRTGWFKVFFGKGQRIELADGTRWTVRARSVAGTICPVVVDGSGRKVAMAGLTPGGYGINGKDWAYELLPTSRPKFGRADMWRLRRHDREEAVVSRTSLSVEASSPVHLGAVLLSFVVVRYGLPEESAPRIPTFRWKTN